MSMTTNIPVFDANKPSVAKMILGLNTPWKMRLFFFKNLPSCWFWGVKVKECTTDRCIVTIPYKWTNKNPFRSVYFAALCGAGELSTGTLAQIAIYDRGRISMLVTEVEASFTKKATGLISFVCEEGKAIQETVQNAIDTGEGQTIKVCSTGFDASNEEVCRIWMTWSFKVR
jgi:hypothetical protein